jgi:hypothetical protein
MAHNHPSFASKELEAANLKALDTCSRQNELLLERLDRLEKMIMEPRFDPDDANSSLLELVYTLAIEKAVKLIPPTDRECSFNWVTGKCSPRCSCEFRPVIGDFHPSRTCRLIPINRLNSSCDPYKRDEPWALRLYRGAKSVAVHIKRSVIDNAPPTDAQCMFAFPAMRCEPEDICKLSYRLGDYNPHRACRLRGDDEQQEMFIRNERLERERAERSERRRPASLEDIERRRDREGKARSGGIPPGNY